MKSIDRASLTFLKMIAYDYDLLSTYSYSELASSILYIVFKMLEAIDPQFPLKQKVEQQNN